MLSRKSDTLLVPLITDSSLFFSLKFSLFAILQPSVFGLPDNIERSVQRAASSLVVAGLRRLGAAAVGAGNFDREM